MFIYVATTPYLRQFFIWKIGCTKCPSARMATYLTGCPPGMTPSCDMVFDGVWETTASSHDELEDIEERIHDHFLQYRMKREWPGDSEWFNFHGLNAPEEMTRFFVCIPARAWIKRQVSKEEIRTILAQQENKEPARFLNQAVHKNFCIIKKSDQRLCALNEIQAPIVAQIRNFIVSNSNTSDITAQDSRACSIIAPCGSGKTVMVCDGIRAALEHPDVPVQARNIIICAPTNQIQGQWYDTLIARKVLRSDDIYYVGGMGTTDPIIIATIMNVRNCTTLRTNCILSTYASSHLLTGLITNENVDLVVLDEAHHMAGTVAQEDTGDGITRKFMSRVAELNIQRISLTYTPRFIRDDDASTSECLSMDDEHIFGRPLAKINLRTLIARGILPDYYVWSLYDESRRGSNMIGKAECLLEAWRATEMVRVCHNDSHAMVSDGSSIKESRNILHHLIIFAQTINEARQLEEYFRARVDGKTRVLRAESGNPAQLRAVIAQFEAAPRAILVNCFVLSEGVDIPCANAVAIMYPKQSYSQIVQMILRAGRWDLNKAVFHVLIPILGSDDMSGYEEVLASLATHDEQIRNEIISLSATGHHCASAINTENDVTHSIISGIIPEHIILEEYESTDITRIKERFASIRRTIFTRTEIAFVRQVCAEHHIDTSVDYAILRAEKYPELPEDPRMTHETWYEFLHYGASVQTSAPTLVADPSQPSCSTMVHSCSMTLAHARRMTCEEFACDILAPNGLRIGWKYDEWRTKQPNADMLPSTQHINDGYFGKLVEDFNYIVNIYFPKTKNQTICRR